MSKITITGAQDGTSKLKKIGDQAFNWSTLTYDGSTEENCFQLPASIETIGQFAFRITYVKCIRFNGTRD